MYQMQKYQALKSEKLDYTYRYKLQKNKNYTLYSLLYFLGHYLSL